MDATVPILIAGFLAGLVRGFAGFGAALFFVPIASIFIAPPAAVVLIAVVDGVLALVMLGEGFRSGVRRLVLPLLVGATLTLPLGAFLLATLDPNPVRWAACVLVLLSVLVIAGGWRYRGAPSWPVAVTAGSVSGFMGGLAGLVGPAVMIFLMSSEMSARNLRGTAILFGAALLVIGAVVFVYLDLVPQTLLQNVLRLAPAFGIGMFLGIRLFAIASDEMFRKIVYVVIALGAVIGLPLFDAYFR